MADFGSGRVYELELWSSNGVRVADISDLANGRSFTLERNEAEEITFNLDLFAIEARATKIGVPAAQLLMPYQMDVKVKRRDQNGVMQYWIGAQITSAVLNIGTDYQMSTGSLGGGAQTFNPTVSVTAKGYLDLFKDRYTGSAQSYSQQETIFIGGDLLTQTQAQTNGNVGVTLAPGQYATGILRDRNYARDNVKTSLQNLTTLVDGRFDFAFSWDKKFQTYAMIGSPRTDLRFTWGGPDGNVIGLYLERSGRSLYNRIIGLGSGFGVDQLVSAAPPSNDTTSQINNLLREDIKQYNSVRDQSTLDQNAAADLALKKDVLQIPQITITGKELQGMPFLSVGDRIPLKFSNHSFLAGMDGTYRIERMVVNLDDNDFEKEIELYFDTFALTS